MSGTSKVGQGAVYEAGDQRNPPDSEVKQKDRYNEGQPNSHVPNDSSSWPTLLLYIITLANLLFVPAEDQRSIANRLAREEKVGESHCSTSLVLTTVFQRQNEPEPKDEEAKLLQQDPTLPVE